MDKRNVTKVIHFLIKYRCKGICRIGIENGLTRILTSIELLDTVHSIAIRRKKIEK